MGQVLRGLWALFVGFFRVSEKAMLAVENVVDVAVATSGAYKDEAERDRAIAESEAEAARLVREVKAKAALQKAKDAQAAQQAQSQQSNQP